MRGDDLQQAGMFSYLSPEQRVPQDHPLRAIRKLSDAVFAELSPQFDKLYAPMGRPSIAPEKLLRALLLQVLYSVRRSARTKPINLLLIRIRCCAARAKAKKRSWATPAIC